MKNSRDLLNIYPHNKIYWYQWDGPLPAPTGGFATELGDADEGPLGWRREGIDELRAALNGGYAVYLEIPGGHYFGNDVDPDLPSHGTTPWTEGQYEAAQALRDQYQPYLVCQEANDRWRYDEEGIAVRVGVEIPDDLYDKIVENL